MEFVFIKTNDRNNLDIRLIEMFIISAFTVKLLQSYLISLVSIYFKKIEFNLGNN